MSRRRGRHVVARARKTFASVIIVNDVSAIQPSKPPVILRIMCRTKAEKGMHTTLAANTITTTTFRRWLIWIGYTRHRAHRTMMSSALTSMAVMAVQRLTCEGNEISMGIDVGIIRI